MTIYDKITFNIFTNCTVNSPDIFPMNLLFESFIETFDLEPSKMALNIYIDVHPYESRFEKFKSNIKKYFDTKKCKPTIVQTKSLVDGFVKSLEADTEFIMNMEHDFFFYKRNIEHTLDEILKGFNNKDVNVIRFHHSSLKITKYDKYLNETKIGDLLLYETPETSNYMQIIKRKTYIEKYLKFLDQSAIKSYGIENNLRGQPGFYIYPGKNKLRNLQHINGRKMGGWANKLGEMCKTCGKSKADTFSCTGKERH